MAFPRDQIPYSAIIDRPALRLPKSARVVEIAEYGIWSRGNAMTHLFLGQKG